ncbi:SARP family transcriptional regulator [Virgisporangium aliadipatigenens]|uniref:SARP family transcriptional regulator n=1 Tax=Virgisporangium aliadipatigenens TaxID=741659 RepID=A0A8J3YTY1_9ACTN|nr:BTAD domain-containing putative transcriptional regulator [Virgisporangium aliadipatigenens]GIJ50403.1 SARP family transcriptional regulator [Virgisporangium aliadipatigenens]
MDEAARLRVDLLGGFAVSRGGEAVSVPGTRLRRLAARLALAGGRTVGAGVLAEAIWGAEPPAEPVHALQTLVWRLRKVLGSTDAVTQVADGYRLAVRDVDVDVLRFEQQAAAGRESLHAGDPRAAVDALGAALTLPGLRPGAEPALLAAVAPAVSARLAHASVDAVTDLAEAEIAVGHADAAAARLTALLAGQPVHERAVALLMDAFAAQGRTAEALAVYERFRGTLAEALGADPGSLLRDRHLGLLRAQPSAPVAATPAERLGPGNLPAPLTSFIGRDDELARIAARLRTGRLITVLGPGGAGKTRLAVEAARRHQRDFHDGAWLIDLASITEPAKIGAAVLAGIGSRSGNLLDRREDRGAGDVDVLVDQLGGREILLVVDNCEHLADAASHLLTALLTRCSGLRVVATSREPLAVDGEALVPLGPLALPTGDLDLGRARAVPSVRLFTERAAAVRPGFDVEPATWPDIRRVVCDLDGMPLALELAAARLRTLSLPELADGLTDRFRLLTTGNRTALPRHRSLSAVIAWSWDLLTQDERTLAERISVLPGGVTRASATAVCAGSSIPAGAVPDLLAGLVERSLLQLGPAPGRYRMLDTIREYGAGRLAAGGDLAAVRDRAAGHFTELVAGQDAGLRGPGQLAAMEVIGAEYDNLQAALRHLCATGDSTGAVGLALALSWYWQMSGRRSDATYWLGEALATPGGPAPDRARVVHLFSQAGIWSRPPSVPAGEDHRAIRELSERLLAGPAVPGPQAALVLLPLAFLLDEKAVTEVVDELTAGDDVWLCGYAYLLRAQFLENVSRIGQMRSDVEAALDCFRRAGDRWSQACALSLRAQLRLYDDLDGALADLRESRSLAARFGSPTLGDRMNVDLRWIELHLRSGDTDRAIATIEAARARAARVASSWTLAVLDVREAGIRVRRGELSRAAELLDTVPPGRSGVTAPPGDMVRALAGCARAGLCLRLGDGAGAATALSGAFAAARRSGDLPLLSAVTVHAAELAAARGRPEESAVLLGAAAGLRGTDDDTDPLIRELAGQVRAELGREEFAEAYAEGRALDRDTVSRLGDPGS